MIAEELMIDRGEIKSSVNKEVEDGGDLGRVPVNPGAKVEECRVLVRSGIVLVSLMRSVLKEIVGFLKTPNCLSLGFWMWAP